ncbi:hypothetical protein BV898_16363 [Hypsibius exemplaris]|uniref:Uncharacterized protein n=1 Tax=Hypsibius exemplaris TaxID=2072580 RepID=A0A9X6NDA3_HYPEX|nr:hypothetical protein BV898_16363 [Hypsibius exemplaris]
MLQYLPTPVAELFNREKTDEKDTPIVMVPLRKLIHCSLAVLLIILQAACLDYYLITLNRETYGLAFLAWIVADCFVVGTFVFTDYLAVQYVKRQAALQDPGTDSSEGTLLRHMSILPYGWARWLIYSFVLVAKIVTAFKTFGPSLSDEHIGEINLMEFTIGGTAGVFMLMLEGTEKLTTNAQKHYVRWMQNYVLLEIIDCVEFLTLLFAVAEGGPYAEPFPETLQNIILTFACINLMAPAVALYRLSSRHNRHAETRNRFFLSQTLVGTLFGNLPYFVVRVYLWDSFSLVTGLFAMKNLIGIVKDTKELVAYVQDVARGRLDGSEESVADGGSKQVRVTTCRTKIGKTEAIVIGPTRKRRRKRKGPC